MGADIHLFIDHEQTRISNPDWYSHSWLNASELREVLSDPKVKFNETCHSEYYATLLVLEHFEKIGDQARIVFWFDS